MSKSFFGAGEGILGVLSRSTVKIPAGESGRDLDFELGGVDGVTVVTGRPSATAE